MALPLRRTGDDEWRGDSDVGTPAAESPKGARPRRAVTVAESRLSELVALRTLVLAAYMGALQ